MQLFLTQEFGGLDVNREILNVLLKWILITKVNYTHCNNNHINFCTLLWCNNNKCYNNLTGKLRKIQSEASKYCSLYINKKKTTTMQQSMMHNDIL